jgi:hypothetical protein
MAHGPRAAMPGPSHGDGQFGGVLMAASPNTAGMPTTTGTTTKTNTTSIPTAGEAPSEGRTGGVLHTSSVADYFLPQGTDQRPSR